MKTKADVECCNEAILEFRKNLDQETVIDQVLEMINRDSFELIFIPNAKGTKAGAFIYRLPYLRNMNGIHLADGNIDCPIPRILRSRCR